MLVANLQEEGILVANDKSEVISGTGVSLEQQKQIKVETRGRLWKDEM